MNLKQKTLRLTALRKAYWEQETLLRWLSKQKKLVESRAVRSKMSEINKEISDLIWEGAELRHIHSPDLDEKMLDALGELLYRKIGVEPKDRAILIYFALSDGSPFSTAVTPCDDPREGYYCIAGRVQNLTEWIDRVKNT